MAVLIPHSIDVIQRYQAASGAYVACPTFPTYHYCWFRDGAFTAYAMDLYGETASAAAFHDWAATAILKRKQVVRQALMNVQAGQPLEPQNELHTRYTLEGDDGLKEEWPNHQLDGFGTWLWALGEHDRLTRAPLPQAWLTAAHLVADYLTALWNQPCYDCWEEFPQHVHTATLGAIYGGLSALAKIEHSHQFDDTLAAIRAAILEKAVYKGYLVKFPGSFTVDASLIGLAVPYNVFDLDDPLIKNTIQRIEISLLRGGGVHRYPTDTYFGGGAWSLLTAWLGWYYARTGSQVQAQAALQWIEAQATSAGDLPEQVPLDLNDPNYYEPWVDRWGPPATPLLWSHANYLILAKALEPLTTG